METKTWNFEELRTEFQSCENLAQIIQAIENLFWKNGQVLCHVFVNGLRLDEKDESRFAKTSVVDIKDLKVVAQKTEELVLESMRSAVELLGPLKSQSLDLCESFRSGSFKEAQHSLSQALDGCHWLAQVMHFLIPQLKALQVDPWTLQQWSGLHGEYSNVVKQMLAAFEGQDFVLLGDLIEYELCNLFDKMLDLFGSTIKIVED